MGGEQWFFGSPGRFPGAQVTALRRERQAQIVGRPACQVFEPGQCRLQRPPHLIGCARLPQLLRPAQVAEHGLSAGAAAEDLVLRHEAAGRCLQVCDIWRTDPGLDRARSDRGIEDGPIRRGQASPDGDLRCERDSFAPPHNLVLQGPGVGVPVDRTSAGGDTQPVRLAAQSQPQRLRLGPGFGKLRFPDPYFMGLFRRGHGAEGGQQGTARTAQAHLQLLDLKATSGCRLVS